MVLAQPFTTASPNLVNFDFKDIQAGTGTNIYYCAVEETDSGLDYVLLTDPEYSALIEIAETAGATTNDYDFDLKQFNLPQTLKGTATFACGIAKAGTGDFSVTAQLVKWDGSSETVVTSAISSQVIGNTEEEMVLIELPVTQTNFKKGDVLRLIVQTVTAGSWAGTGYLGTDPIGRDGVLITAANKVTTIMKVHVPFRIE